MNIQLDINIILTDFSLAIDGGDSLYRCDGNVYENGSTHRTCRYGAPCSEVSAIPRNDGGAASIGVMGRLFVKMVQRKERKEKKNEKMPLRSCPAAQFRPAHAVMEA